MQGKGDMREAGTRESGLGAPDGNRKWWTLAVIGSGTFMSALDTSIVNIALPVIEKTTGAAVSTVEWVVLTYLITVSSSLLVFGRLADIYGKRRIYLLGLSVFVLGSVFCGIAGRVGVLIPARAFQAVGAAMIFALSPAILVGAFPPAERGRALGMQATMTYLGLVAGPGLGGVLIDCWGWPAIFYMNVPVGLATMGIAWRVLGRERPGPGAGHLFDPWGASAMAVALAALLFVLSKGGELGWGHPWITGLAAVAVCAAAAFVAIERRVEHPALDLGLFLSRRFSASVLAAYLCYVAAASVGFLMPFFLVSAAGCTAAHTGAVMMSIPLAMVLLTGPSGALSDRVGVRVLATAGMAVMTVGILLLGTLGLEDSSVRRAACLCLVGVGSGLFTAPNNSAIMGAVPAARQGVAGAVLSATRTVGFASGVAGAGIVYLACLKAAGPGPAPEAVAHAVQVGLRLTAAVALASAFCSAVRGRSAGK